MEKIEIIFAKPQKLPPGYKIEWWEADEHYHWVLNANTYSCAFVSRWQAYRSAWARYNYLENPADHIEFAIYLTGHDRETIEQMYRDWKR